MAQGISKVFIKKEIQVAERELERDEHFFCLSGEKVSSLLGTEVDPRSIVSGRYSCPHFSPQDVMLTDRQLQTVPQ